MKKLLQLELKRSNLRPYISAVVIITICMAGMLYLFAFVPLLDPTDTDVEMFTSYNSLIKLHSVICMAVFAVLSAVMHAKTTIEEYGGKQSIMLFLYPIKRSKLLDAKLNFVFIYTVIATLLSSIVIYIVFFLTESIFPICPDTLSIHLLINCTVNLICNSFIAGLFGVISLWIGFYKKSVSTTIVASCIIVSLCSQILTGAFTTNIVSIVFLAISIFLAVLAVRNLHSQVDRMEV